MRRTTPKERRKKERNKSKLSLYNHEDALKVLGKINQRLPFLSAIFLAVIFQTLCFAESIQGVGSGEGAHYFEYNQSRSINARHYGLIPDSSIDQSSMLVRAIKYASENKEIDCVRKEFPTFNQAEGHMYEVVFLIPNICSKLLENSIL